MAETQMKKLTIIASLIVITFAIYLIFLYRTGKKETFIFDDEFEGVVFIVYNAGDGVLLNMDDLLYEFKNSGTLKVKNDFQGGFSPWGLTNYYYKDKNGVEHNIEVDNSKPEEINKEESDLKVWSASEKTGECNGRVYVTFIVSRRQNYSKYINEQWKQLNLFCVK